MKKEMTRRIFLQRTLNAAALVAFLPLTNFQKTSVQARRAKRSSRDLQYYEHTILAMGTTARLGVYAGTEAEANAAINASFQELKRLEGLFTVYDAESEISQINAASGKRAVRVSQETIEILQRSKEFATLTNGAFDVTVEPLMRLWGFREESNELKHLPTSEEIERVLPYIGSKLIEIDATAQTVSLAHENTKLDLGGIAVGYSLDRIEQILRARGITRAFLDISGDIIALGAPDTHPDGWQVAIPDPNNLAQLIYQTSLKDMALATSGNYMSYVVYQAQKYGHIMDPRIGRSAMQVLSATAIARSGIVVDALSTGSFVRAPITGAGATFVMVDGTGELKTA